MQQNVENIRFKHRIEYIFFKAFLLGIKLTPRFMVNCHRRFVIFVFRKIGEKYSRLVSKNLEIAFPHATPDDINSLKEKVYQHFAGIFIEIGYLFAHRNANHILQKTEVRGLENLIKTLEKKRGAIIFSGHFGNWELVPLILKQQLAHNIYGIARRMHNPLVDRTVKSFREFMGLSMIYKSNSIRTVLKVLENNETVFFLVDHNAIDREAVPIDFFGKRVNAVTSVARLHIKKHIPLVPIFVHYEPGKIVMEVKEEINFTKTHDLQADIEKLTARCLAIIEEEIKKYPEQWFWFHDRWRIKQSLKNGEPPRKP